MLQLSTKQYNAMIRPGFYRWRATWLLLLLLSSVLLGLRESRVLAAPRAVEAPPTYRNQWGSQGSGFMQFNAPVGVATDSSGNLYVADTNNHRIQKFNSSGSYLSQFGSMGSGNGQFNRPAALAVDSSGNLYVADGLNNRIQKFTSAGVYLTQWGGFGSGDGQLRTPLALALDSSGNLYVADTANNRIQKFTNNGVYLTQWGSTGNGVGQFSGPRGVALDSSGNIYVTDTGNHRVQVFTYGPVNPEIALYGNNFLIDNGDSTPNSSDYTDFGSVPASGGAIVRTFVIGNTGIGALTVTPPTVTGGFCH